MKKSTFELKPFLMSAVDYHDFRYFAGKLHDNGFGKWEYKEIGFVDGGYRAVFWREDTEKFYKKEIADLMDNFDEFE